MSPCPDGGLLDHEVVLGGAGVADDQGVAGGHGQVSRGDRELGQLDGDLGPRATSVTGGRGGRRHGGARAVARGQGDAQGVDGQEGRDDRERDRADAQAGACGGGRGVDGGCRHEDVLASGRSGDVGASWWRRPIGHRGLRPSGCCRRSRPQRVLRPFRTRSRPPHLHHWRERWCADGRIPGRARRRDVPRRARSGSRAAGSRCPPGCRPGGSGRWCRARRPSARTAADPGWLPA